MTLRGLPTVVYLLAALGISTTVSACATQPYSLRPIYFRRDQFKTTADCLTAAYDEGLPLEVCQ